MSKKRQRPVFDPQGSSAAQLTTFSHNFPDKHVVTGHYHHQGQVLFASKGVMTIRTPHGTWVVPPLRAVWIPGDEVHSIVMTGAVLMRTLYFAPSLAERFSKKCFVLNVSPLLRELILHACSKREWKLRAPRDGRLIEIILEQLVEAPSVPLRLPEPRDARALRIVEILVADPSDGRTLEELCKKAGGSKRTIERVFLEDTGMTFGKWRQQLRLLHGLRLLASGEKVLTAALESGYSSASAFIFVFKRALGQSPSRYVGLR